MVHNPVVTTLLSRLGGLYRDPARVDRDASSLLKSSVGVHLKAGIAPLVENNGDTSNCLVLQGTIAIVFKGTTYQLLVDIYLPPGYPLRPPVSYVRLAENMFIKENHPHVGSDGMVYLPYLNEWNHRTHSLIENVVAMSSVFSAEPPVFTRHAAAPPPPPPPPPVAVHSSGSANPPPPAYVEDYASQPYTTNNESAEAERYMRQQIEAIMAREAEETAQAARKAAKEAEEREQQITAQKEWEEKKKTQVKEEVNLKIQAHLSSLAEQTKTNVQADWRDQQYLKQSKEAIETELEASLQTVEELELHIAAVEAKTVEIETWLEDAKSSGQDEKVDVDDLCQPVSKFHVQMLDLSAENAAITDALYFLDRGMYTGNIDCNTHLKAVRKLAKRQFLVRAHLIKINEVMLREGR